MNKKPVMRILLRLTRVALLAAACADHRADAASFSFFSGGAYKAATNITQQGSIPAEVKSLEVDNSFGAVRVVGTDNATGDWTWKFTVRAPTDAAVQKFAAKTTCTAKLDGSRLRLGVDFPNSSGNLSFQSDLELHVPKSIAVKTQNRFGPTEISDLAGDVQATGQHGPATLHKLGGKVRAETSFAALKVSVTGTATLKNQNGPITATQVQGPLTAETSFATLTASKIGGTATLRNQNGAVEATDIGGNVDIKTSFSHLKVKGAEGNAILVNQNGSIETRGVTGSVEASTSFGRLDVEAAGPNVLCRNQNNSLRLRLTSNLYTNIVASTSFGTLELLLPAEPKPAIQARTSLAEIESDFPVLMKPRGQNPFDDVPPGTPRIKLENQNANIIIKRQ